MLVGCQPDAALPLRACLHVLPACLRAYTLPRASPPECYLPLPMLAARPELLALRTCQPHLDLALLACP